MILADAAHLPLRDGCVQCVVTSPPYWGLRDYGLPPLVWGGEASCAHEWGDALGTRSMTHQDRLGNAIDPRTGNPAGGNVHGQPGGFSVSQGAFCLRCSAWRGSLGLEPQPDLYVVAIFREVRRVLRDDGTLWLNLGDSYAGSGPSGASYQSQTTKRRANMDTDGAFRISKTLGERGLTYADKKPIPPPGLKPKDLVGIPWRVAFALQADGWYLRSDIIWAKPNPMPESVTDRPTKSHEYLFLLAKSGRYYYDAEAIKEASTYPDDNRKARQSQPDYDGMMGPNGQIRAVINPLNPRTYPSRNRRSVWTIATEPYPEAHFATFPPDLVTPCILAGTSAKGECVACGAPWRRMTEKGEPFLGPETWGRLTRLAATEHCQGTNGTGATTLGLRRHSTTTGWHPTCDCGTTETRAQLVCDPFAGSGTVGLVAHDLGRRFVGVELNPAYVGLAQRRIAPRQAVMEW